MPDKLAKPDKFCPKCGTLRSMGMRFCANCGYRFPSGDGGAEDAAADAAAQDIPDSPAEITVVSQTGSIPPVQDAPSAVVHGAGADVPGAKAGAHAAASIPVPLPGSMHGTVPLPTRRQHDDDHADEEATRLMAPQALPTLPIDVSDIRAGATTGTMAGTAAGTTNADASNANASNVDAQQTMAMPAPMPDAATAAPEHAPAPVNADDRDAVNEQKTEVIAPLAGGASTQVLPPMQGGGAAAPDDLSPLARLAAVSNVDTGTGEDGTDSNVSNAAGGGAAGGNGNGTPGAGVTGGGPADPNAKRVRMAIIIAVVVVALAVIGGGWALWAKHQHTAAMEACVAAQNDFDAAKTSMNATLKKVKSTAGTDESKLTDANTLTDLKDLISQGSKDVSVNEQTCTDGMSTKDLNAQADAIGLKTKALKALDGKLDTAAKAVTASKNKKAFNEAESSLKKAYTKAEQLVSNATGKVADVNTLTSLKQALTSAKQALDAADDADTSSSDTVDEMNTQLKALNTAMDKVNASVKAKQAADAKKKAEEEKKKADKARCSSIAGNYGGFQFDELITVASDCSVTYKPNFGAQTTAKYVANSYKGSGKGASWKLSNGKTMTLYPAGTSAPVIDKLFSTAFKNQASQKSQVTSKTQLQSGDKAYVAD
ncbi:hypothetical protein KIH77_07710 [Bifidobacterium sp. 82T24]|uniref:zinc-ribbon domain-containing protein n=1 Tax=Bifidobacterium pluvialisilvae TaxID=2834436 RepID=UPI001C573423|nr:zinc-ribbon domain-containing protein [Bifidobacterium pluvialisilvae]MBW3088612.1 hypothetical protein [Bifidobacterium pluvialisilvae]